MMKTEVTSNVNGIIFILGDRRFYSIPWKLLDIHGKKYWLNHLEEKNWFLPKIKDEFVELCDNHLCCK